MAGIADMLVQSTLATANEAPDIGGSIQKGAQLAQTLEQIQQSRQDMESKKQMLQLSKVEKVMNAFEAGMKFEDKAAQSAYYKNYIPSMIRALKVDDVFTPEMMQFAQASPEMREKIVGLKLDIQDKINNGDLKGAQILEYAKSRLTPEEMANFDAKSLLEQQKFATAEANKKQRAFIVQGAQAERQQAKIRSAGQEAADKAFAQDFVEWNAAGGKAGVQKNIETLQGAISRLEKNKDFGGPVVGNLPDEAIDSLNPGLATVRDSIRDSVQSTLRQTLGAQFTEKEGQAIFNRAFNPRLSNAENAKRAKKVLKELQTKVDAKDRASRYFEENGTLSGFKSATPKTEKAPPKKVFKSLSPAAQAIVVRERAKALKISEDEARKQLENQ